MCPPGGFTDRQVLACMVIPACYLVAISLLSQAWQGWLA